jgi:hypothetical protein
MSKPFTFIKNVKEFILPDNIIKHYPISWGETNMWDECKLEELCDDLKYIVITGSEKLHMLEYVVDKNPDIFIERHHINLIKGRKNYSRFGIHTDDNGPAGGKCYTILYYYQIDDFIDDGELNFYNHKYSDSGLLEDILNYTPVEIFHPRSGDIIAFENDIHHCPGEFTTQSSKPVARGLLSIFIKLE